MGDNVYIAYALWLLTGRFGGHRFYPGKFASGFAMTALFFIGYSLAWAVASCFFSRFFASNFLQLTSKSGRGSYTICALRLWVDKIYNRRK